MADQNKSGQTAFSGSSGPRIYVKNTANTFNTQNIVARRQELQQKAAQVRRDIGVRNLREKRKIMQELDQDLRQEIERQEEYDVDLDYLISEAETQ